MSRELTPQPNPGSTFLLLLGLMLSYFLLSGTTPTELAQSASIGIGLSLIISTFSDLKNLRNLVRTDIMALAALYFLTLFEFLLPQPDFNHLVTLEETRVTLPLCYLAFAGIAIGRHFALRPSSVLLNTLKKDFPPKLLIFLFGIAIFGGYFYQLLAVDFNVPLWFDYMMAPRFSQPWTRGQLGDWKALFGELGMIVNLAPPIAGVIFAQRKKYSRNVLVFVGCGLALTLFTAFAGGTRNVLATYLATFAVAYAFSLPRTKKKELVLVASCSVAALLISTFFMLEFRNIGFSNYLKGYRAGYIDPNPTTLFVDYNLYVMAKLTNVFPEEHEFLGLEIPYLAMIRPIPRAIWSNKPEGMSMSVEDSLGVQGLTLASSFIGEAYISGGRWGVLLTALIFGSITGWWNRFGSPNNSAFGHLVFASGFFAAVISMRSMLVFTTAILPTIAALLLGFWMLRTQPVQRLIHHHLQHDEPEN